jgi:hypothetical protein
LDEANEIAEENGGEAATGKRILLGSQRPPGNQLVPVGSILPGDHPCSDGCGDQRKDGPAPWIKENVIIGK